MELEFGHSAHSLILISGPVDLIPILAISIVISSSAHSLKYLNIIGSIAYILDEQSIAVSPQQGVTSFGSFLVFPHE